MIETRIKEIAEKRGIKTAYQLKVALGISPSMASRLYRNDVEKISLHTLDSLCNVLKCKPNDILRFTPDESRPG
jgi:DNA-binding Xre family transcriptional regulator